MEVAANSQQWKDADCCVRRRHCPQPDGLQCAPGGRVIAQILHKF